ncbi:MAG: uracil-DNA glycosylase [Burkholderiales bacterium]|nr:uracil-DNA glycosylase [Burkholderiales bacterium]
MTQRDVILREMGLTPLWHDRTATTPPASPPATATRQTLTATAVTARPADPSPASALPDTSRETNRDARINALDWEGLVADIARCTACRLSKTRTHTVPGAGDRTPAWMVVGEAPGENEDKRGEPFVGKAGQLLDAMLAAVGKRRGDGVYIANVIKCRPPGNRNPEPDEIAACAPYLHRQIALAQPKLLLAAGKFSGQTLLGREDTVGAMRATGGQFQGIPVVVTYHPSYLLRSPLEKAKAWDDLMKARALVP